MLGRFFSAVEEVSGLADSYPIAQPPPTSSLNNQRYLRRSAAKEFGNV